MSKADDPRYGSTGGVTPGFENASAPGPTMSDGQHSSYWVLSEAERAKGFVRPVRKSYRHVRGKACCVVTTMGQALAESAARDPKFYGATFCCGCGGHFPVDEFDWHPDGDAVGS